ncbi:LysR family transcriptional regulator [Paenibacillus tritici]|uniref:LysR family transcriptional regulator n=1 Tax=Paenibacillus tritici TaxID=1873425 RepID=UPI001BA58417|nr:LysR family transcriptional regulator [Paenibacillus tritici]QUL53484.1 LysR family transcriptional regulator [Paenibacillus tritici]
MADYEWYRSFIAIYKHHSVSEAAKTRMMTQPAMSQHLAALEAEVGEALFRRTSRKMIPTERGKELYSQLAPLIESLDEVTINLNCASLSTLAVVRIGTHHEFFSAKILPQIQKYNMRTVVHFSEADQLLQLLNEDKLDLIITSKKIPAAGIEYLKLMEEAFVVVAPEHYEIPIGISLIAKEIWLATQNWMSYGLELPGIRRIWREHFKKRPLIRPVHIIPDYHLILRAIENGVGLGVMPTYIFEQAADKSKSKVIFVELTVKNELFIACKHKHKHLSSIHEFMKSIYEDN